MKMIQRILVAFFLILVLASIESPVHAIDLIAAKSGEVVGSLSLWNQGPYLYVKYEITNSHWCMTKTYLHLGMSPDQIPQTKSGNPILGRFDYRGLFGPNPDGNVCGGEYTYKIQLSGYSGTLYIAAYSDLSNRDEHNQDGAWADGVRFSGDKSARYFAYTFEIPR